MLRRQELQRPRNQMAAPSDERRDAVLPSSLPSDDAVLLVRGIVFTGDDDLLTEDEKRRLASLAVGRELGLPGLNALRDRTTAMLQARGFLLARAVLPPQDVTGGTVSIRILQGRLEAVDYARAADTRVRQSLVQAIGEASIRSDRLLKSDLETALLRMNDLPGVTAQARLSPGTAADTSRLTVDIREGPILSGMGWVDNYGDASTGRAQGNALLSVADATGFAERASVRATVSEGMFVGGLDLSVPVGPHGVFLNGGYTYLDYRKITPTGRALDLTGFSHQAALGAEWRAVRTRNVNVTLDARLAGKVLVDDSLVGRLADKRSLSLTLGLSGDLRDDILAGGFTWWNASATFGDLDLSRLPGALAADAAGLRTDGSFARFNAGVSRVQGLRNGLSVLGRVAGQWASGNLDSSEEFSLGGPYGVRAWPVGEGQGDMGVVGSLELRYDLPSDGSHGRVQLAAFVDAGHVWLNRSPGAVPAANLCACNDYSLFGAGVGVNWTRRNFGFSASWAHALGSNPGADAVTGLNSDGGSSRQAFWLRGTGRF